jgi:mono/diheme cytochrome c family protein
LQVLNVKKIALAATAAAGLLASGQIALGQTTTAAPAAAPAAPAAVAPAAPPAAAAPMAAAPAAATNDAATGALIEQVCSACHDIAMVQNGNRSAADWADTVQTMRDRGAQLTDDQAKLVVDYLARNFPPK